MASEFCYPFFFTNTQFLVAAANHVVAGSSQRQHARTSHLLLRQVFEQCWRKVLESMNGFFKPPTLCRSFLNKNYDQLTRLNPLLPFQVRYGEGAQAAAYVRYGNI